MTEYIYDTSIEATFLHKQKREEIVRCRDCKYGIDGGEYCAEDCADSWDWRCVEPNGFCAWGERKERESAKVWNQWSADDVTCSEES